MNREKSITPREALLLLTQYCSREERCIFDVKQKLKSFQLPESSITEITEQLIHDKYIDETRYAQAFANDKYKFNKWGKFKISFALQQKHIPDSIIQQVIENIPDEGYNNLLESELIKKMKTLPDSLSNFEKRGKLYRFAASRGFSYDEVNKVLDALLK